MMSENNPQSRGQEQRATEKGRDDSVRPLEILQQTITQRQADLQSGHARQLLQRSYTAQLLAGGLEKIGPKVMEEAAELVEAAQEPGRAGRAHTIREGADLIYHFLLLLASRDIRFTDIEAELATRQGISGLEEKAARKKE